MKSPSEITAEAVQDELYARATFANLISRSACEFRTAIERDSRAQSEFMARYILDYYDEYFESTPPEHGLELIEAARLAARTGEPHIRCRVEKDFARILCYLGRFASSDATLRCASMLASRTDDGEGFLAVRVP